MLKIAATVTLALCGVGIFLDMVLGADAFIFAPLECDEKGQKVHKKVFWIYNIVLLGMLILSFILNYLHYNK